MKKFFLIQILLLAALALQAQGTSRKETVIRMDSQEKIDKARRIFRDHIEKHNRPQAPLHLVYPVNSIEDLERLDDYFYTSWSEWGTTFEVEINDKLVGQAEVTLRTPEDIHLRLIVSGKGDQPVEMHAITFILTADEVEVDNLDFRDQTYMAAIVADVRNSFKANNLGFYANAFDRYWDFLARPLITLSSRAEEERAASYSLKNVAFVGNRSTALLLIDKESPGKFDHIELDHVTLENNVDISMGIDLSAQTEATVRDCTIIGSTAAPALVQILPQTQVTMENCTVGDRVFSYQPEKENWQTDPKPLIKKNVTETREAVFDRVP